MVMKILIPVDGSEHALRAVRSLIEKRGWFAQAPEFHLLNVQLPVASGAVKMFIPADQLREYYEDEGRAALKSARDLVEAAGVPFHARVAVGDLARTIVQYANEQGCELIAMGTRGMGAVSNALLGSVATKVVHQAHIPVLLIN
jgi:nucleotide-binding universal stress UspA family protein